MCAYSRKVYIIIIDEKGLYDYFKRCLITWWLNKSSLNVYVLNLL